MPVPSHGPFERSPINSKGETVFLHPPIQEPLRISEVHSHAVNFNAHARARAASRSWHPSWMLWTGKRNDVRGEGAPRQVEQVANHSLWVISTVSCADLIPLSSLIGFLSGVQQTGLPGKSSRGHWTIPASDPSLACERSKLVSMKAPLFFGEVVPPRVTWQYDLQS